MSNTFKILGVKIDNLSRDEILQKAENFLESENFYQIVTTNAEFILKAQDDKKFKQIINQADLSVADSISIFYAFLRNFQFLKARFSGVDLMQEILKLAEKKKIPIFLVARKRGLSNWKETKMAILQKFPDLKIEGVDFDVEELRNFYSKITDKFFSKIFKNNKTKKKQIVFCNFGAPEQDKFIDSLRNYNLKICLGMGVGGSFDFLTGKAKRASKWMRLLGLEWLFRLGQQFFIKQPKNSSVKSYNRWKRVFKAVIVFPIRVLLKR